MNDDDEKRERKIIIRDILLKILKFFDINIKKNAILHVAFCLILQIFCVLMNLSDSMLIVFSNSTNDALFVFR